MVFYPLVIRGAVQRHRQIEAVRVGEEWKECEVPQTVDELMRRPTLAVKRLSFQRGWYFSPLPSYPDRTSPRKREETLGETLNRMQPGETLSDVFQSAASRPTPCSSRPSRRKKRPAEGVPADQLSRTNASLLYGEEQGAGRIRMTSHSSNNSNSLFGSRGSLSEDGDASVRRSARSLHSLSSNSSNAGAARPSGGGMRNPSFHPVDTTVPGQGCMRVRSLKESLDSCKCGGGSLFPGEAERDKGRHGFMRRLRPRRGRSSKSNSRSNNADQEGASMGMSSQRKLGASRFGRTGSSSHLDSIQFGNISIREYANTMGDNPSCGDGPALSLGWAFKSQPIVMSIDDYESSRPPRRVLDALAIPQERREKILVRLGFSYEDILQAIVEKRYDQACREQTLSRLKYQALEERLEALNMRCDRRT